MVIVPEESGEALSPEKGMSSCVACHREVKKYS